MASKRIARLLKEQKGFTFIEVLVGVAIMGMVVAAFMMALATAFKANMIAQVRTTADSLARAQMEYIKSQSYGDEYNYFPTYPVDYYPRYSLYWLDGSDNAYYLVNPEDTDNNTFHPTSSDNGLQKIVILVKHNNNDILSLEGYKAER